MKTDYCFSVRHLVRTTYTILLLFLVQYGYSQPGNMSINQDVSGTYTNTTMTAVGSGSIYAYYTARFQENGSGTSSGTRNWQFNSDGYSNTWGARSANTLSSYNSVITPNTGTASGNWAASCSPGCYNAFGKLGVTGANKYYTYNIRKGSSYASQDIAVLETSFNPRTFSALSASFNSDGTATASVTMTGALSSGEYLYVAYSTDAFATSGNSGVVSVGALNGSFVGTATIPALSGTVSYYAFTSTSSTAPAFSAVPLLTLNMYGTGSNSTTYASYYIDQPKYFCSGNFTPPNTFTEASSSAMSTVSGLTGITTTTYLQQTSANSTATSFFKFFGATSGSTYYGPAASTNSDSAVAFNTKFGLATTGRTQGKSYSISATSGNVYIFKTSGYNTSTARCVVINLGGSGSNPSTVSTVSASSTCAGTNVTITATLNTSFPTGQLAYLRYSTSSTFATSTVVAMSGSGTSYTATIPSGTNVAGTPVYYYVFTSGTSGPASDGSDADLFAINIKSNSGSAYTYTPTAAPTTANAGPDQTSSATCGLTSVTLAANTPTVGTGAWSIVSGSGGTITTPSSPTSTFTGTAGTTYTLRWTISNSPCTASTDDVVITFNQNPTTSNAGPDQTSSATCGLTSVTLAANTPTVGTGAWSVVSGTGGSFGNASSPTSTFSGTAGSTYTLRWTISNSPCTASTDDVVITFNQNPTTSNAGPDQTSSATCGLTSVTLAANTPTIGTGAWSVVSGSGGSFGNASSPTSTFSGTAGTTYTLRWTISNSPCTASTDDVVITFNQNPTTSNAGSDQTICSSGTATLAANSPTIGTGVWTVVSGPSTSSAQFSNASSPTAIFTPAGGTGTYTLRWTISNSPCTASTDDVDIIVNSCASTITTGSVSGSPFCAGASGITVPFTYSPAGNFSGSTFKAQLSDGSGSFTSPTDLQTVSSDGSGSQSISVTIPSGTGNGSGYRIRVVSNSPAINGSDNGTDLSVSATPTTANAGADQTGSSTCGLTSVTLAANTPTVGTGAWSIVSGSGGSFGNASSPTSTFSGTAGSTYTLRWTISNSPCTASTDDVVITFNLSPTTANAGPDQTDAATCGLTSVTLAANTPTVGTGAWSVVSGTGGSFGNASSPTSTFSGTAGSTYTLRWTISNSPCTASIDDVVITFNQNPTTSNAGPDQTSSATCGLTSVTLAANTPIVGTGAWSVVSGTGGSFGNASSPTSTFSGTAGTTYTLRWTISNSPCTASTDDVVITFNQNPTTSNAGPDQTSSATCGLTSVTLAANTPTVGTGAWSVVSGSGGSFGNASSPTSTFSGTAGTTYTLRWTISNSPCTASTDDVVITFNQNPTTSNAGPDQTSSATCGLTSVTLAANTPTVGTGAWSVVSGSGGSFGNTSSPTSTFSGTAGSTYTLRWTISNSPCTASTDDVVITFNQNPTTSNAGPDQTSSATCGLTSVTLAANTPTVGTGAWSVVSGSGGSFGNASSPTSTFSGTAGSTYTLRWTISNSPCTASTDDVVITFNESPTTSNAGPDQTSSATCGLTSVTLAANTPTVGTGAWNVVSGSGGSFGNASSPTSTFSGTAGTTYTLRWTITNGVCTSTDDVVITFNQNPTTSNAGPDQTSSATCGLTSVTLAANTPTVGTGAWSVVSGTGGSFGNASSPTSTFSGTAGTTYTLRWTISNSPCTASTDDVVITFNRNPTTANAGTTQTICATGTATLAANSPTVGTGAWSVVSGPSTSSAQFSNTAANNATFTPAGGAGTYTLRWTISNSPCTASTSDVTINVTAASNGGTTVATPSSVCLGGTTTLSLSGASASTYQWQVAEDGSTFTNISGATSSTYTTQSLNIATSYRATVTNGVCSTPANSTPVTVTISEANESNAGNSTYNSGWSNSQNDATTGMGAWSLASAGGGGFFTGSSSVNNNNTRTWGMYANGATPASNYARATRTVSMGIGNKIGFSMDNSSVTSGSTVGFSLQNASGENLMQIVFVGGASNYTINDNTSSFNTTVAYTTGGLDVTVSYTAANTYTITITPKGGSTTTHTSRTFATQSGGQLPAQIQFFNNGAGAGGTYDLFFNSLILTNPVITTQPATTQTECQGTTATALSVAASGTGLTYQWYRNTANSYTGGGLSTISGANSSSYTPPTTSAGTTYYFCEVTGSGSCGGTVKSRISAVTVNGTPTTANAGPDQTGAATCGLTSVTLAGNTPSVGTGTWSIVSGTGGTITTPSSPTSTFTGVSGNTYTLRWTISASPCTASTDDVVITFNQSPTTSNAGPDQTSAATCGLTSVTLAANTPTVGTGAWSVVSGTGGSFGNASSPTSTFSGTAGTTYTLRWAISNSPCTASTDDVVITFNQNPTTANAGSPQSICAAGTATLAANTPTIGTGAWSVVSGPSTSSSQFSSTTSPTAVFTPAGGAGSYVLRWTISNSPCTASTSDVTITVSSTNTWTGATSKDWNVASNWSCNAVPTSSTDVVIPSATNTPEIGLSGSNANCKTLTINASGVLTMSNSYTLTVAASGSITNNGTFTAGNGTVIFSGAGEVKGSNATTFNNLTINTGAVTITTVPTINGVFQINGGNITASVKYGSSSTLRYNTTYRRYVEWDFTDAGTIGTSAGYPNNVEITAGTFSLKNGSNNARAMEGSLTIASGATFTMEDITSNLTVKQNVTNNGTLTLSSASGGNIKVGGNWTVGASATQTNNTRYVSFNGASGNQTIAKTGGGNVTFDVLVVDKAAGNVVVSSSPATNIIISHNAGNVFRIINSGAFDLNGRKISFNNDNGSIYVDGSARSITSSVSGGTVDFNAYKTVVNNSGTGSLVIGSNVTVNLNANGNVDFGAGLTTINGTLSLNSTTSCYVNTNPPIYASGSTLVYNTGANYGRDLEWSAIGTVGVTPGYPHNVTINAGSSLDMGAHSGTGTARQISGSLQVDGGFYMDYSTNDMTAAVTISGNITIGATGTLSLSDASGGDIKVNGDWDNYGTFNPKGRAVFFIGGLGDQQIVKSGGETFDFLVVNKTAGALLLNDDITLNQTLTLTSGKITTGAQKVVITSTGGISGGSSSSYIYGNLQRHFATGSSIARAYPIGDASTYAPATITMGTSSTAGSILLNTTGADHPNIGTFGLSATKYVKRYWSATNVGAVFSNTSIEFNYVAGDVQGSGVAANMKAARYTTGTGWTYPTTSGATTYKFTAGGITNSNLQNDYTAGECGGTISFSPSNNGPLCVGSTLNLLSGTVTGNIGSVGYSWSGPSGFTSTSQNPSISNAQTTNGGTYTLTVTDAAGCSNANTTTVVVNAGPTTSNAGPDQTKCNDGNFTLAGNNPGSGTGLWTVVSGTATITTPTAYNSTVTGVPAGTSATLRWTVSNNPCTPSSDDVVLANNALPTTANAGADQTLCNTSTFTMAGNNPASGTGLWSIISGSATITNASLYNTTVTGVAAGTSVTLRWTISNGICSNSTDDVVISNNALPTTAAAGSDQEQCNNGSFTLAGNTPTTGTGAWTVVSGTATITSASSPTSTVTGVPLGTSATLRWTISNGVCTPSTDDVVLTNSYPPDVANAGTDQANCQSGNFTLAGNNPTNGTGAWTVISGTATITTPSAYNSTVTGVPAGTSATLRWTITNGTCTPTTDDVVLTNSNPPTTANAGADQSGCSSGSVTLAGNSPSSGTGTWTIQSGGSGTFSNANSATSTFSAAAGTYVLRWTITTAGCTASYDEATITIVNSPTTANAGPDISQCNNSTFTMAGNTPVFGTGTWTVTSGSATITSPNSPTTSVTVAIGTTATLRWTIANAPCTDSWDEVVLSNSAANLWVGTTSSDWNTGSNWSCGVVPAAGSSITIPSGRPNNPNIGLSGSNASIKDLTIDAGATLTMSSSYTLTFATGGTFTNNGTFTPGNGTIIFNGTGTIAGSSNSTFNNVTINGGVDFGNGKSTINGTLQINGGGYVNTNAPKYGAASTLNYNVNGTYGRNLEWSASGTGTIGTTTGYPNNVVISNNTTLQMGANSGTGTARSLEGNLTVEPGSTFSMSAGGAMTQPITVKGNVTIDGALALSTSAGGDMNVGGDWTVGTSGTQTNNGRLVQFNSSANATQTITKTGGGTVYFDYLNVNNTATNGKLMLSSSPATQLMINSSTNSTSSYQLQLTNGDLDLNGQTFEMNGTVPNSTNIQVSNGIRKITGTTGSSISITGTATPGTPNLKVYPATGSDKLVIDGGASLQTSVGVVFTNTTFNGIFQINRHGFVAGSSLTTDPPVYGVSSTLIYNNENPGFNRNYEWTAATGTLGTTPGYPNDVIVKGNTTPLDIANTGVSSGVRELGIAGKLEVQSGSIVTMSAMNYPLTINGDIQLDGTLILSTNASGTLNIGGNWERGSSATFTQNSRPIRFFGTAPQSINATGGETFSYITVDKTTDKVSLISNLTVTNTIAIDNGTFDVSTGALVVNDVITKGAGGSLISEETGTVVYDKTASSQSVIYAEYGNLTLSNASAKSMANNLAVRGDFTVSGGTVTPGTDIRFSGNRDQAIAGLPNYTNMAFSGTGNHTKRFTSHGAFTGAMTFTGGVGTVDLDGSGDNVNFTAVSNASATARIANVNGWTVAGKAIVERYIPSQRKWRLISIPVTGETIRQSLTRQADGSYPSPSCFGSPAAPVGGSGTLITGHSMSSCTIANAQGYDHVVTGGLSSIRFYNPAQSNPWASLTSTPNVLSAPTQPGYLVFIRGDRNQLEVGSSETTLRPKGYVKQNDQTISINAPFVILGNPYASPIHLDQLYDFNDGTGNKTKITRNFWIWDADLNSSYGGVGGYRYISADIEGDAITSYTSVPSLPDGTDINDYLMVNSGQGVMVQRRNAGGTLTVKENYKYSSSGNTYPFRIKASTVSLFRIDLYRATGNTLEIMMDGTAARFGDEYYKASNEVYDIYKTNQFEENISLVRDNNYLSIESRPVPTSNDTLYVPFYFATERGYALRFTAERMAGKNLTAVLQDAFTATETQVPLDGSEFVYPFSVTTAAASKALNRFRVVFRPGAVTPVIDLFADKGINIYPNPVLKGETMNLQFKNKSAGKYLVTLYDAVGVRVFSKTVVHTGGNGVQKIELPKRLASGTYFAELTDGKGNQGKMKVIIQ